MDWNDLRYFLALARLGSVRAAGKSLGVSHSTAGRRVEALEAKLSIRLFDRSQDGYALTAGGRRMLLGAEAVEREMADLERALVGRDDRLAGTVTVTCGDNFMAIVLIRALGERLSCPDLRAVADVWLLCHPDLRHTARVQATRAVVARTFREQAALFRGDTWSDFAPGGSDFEPGSGADQRIP